MSQPWAGPEGRDFRVYWAGTAASQAGTAITGLAIPLVVLLELHGGATDVGAVRALEFAPYLLLGLPAGLLVDRRRRRWLMIACDAVRALALAAVPLAAAAGVLSVPLVLVVVTVVGCATVPFEIASLSALPWLVGRDDLGGAQAAVQGSGAVAEVAGPGIAGALVAALSASGTLLLDVVSYIVSAGSLLLVHRPEPAVAAPPEPAPLRVELLAGFRQVLRSPLLRCTVTYSAVTNLLLTASQTVLIVFAVRELHFGSATLGLALGAGLLGAPLGAATSDQLARRIGTGPLLLLGATVTSVAGVAAGLTPVGAAAVPLFIASIAVLTLGSLWFNIQSVTLRQSITPPAVLGRVNAAARTISYAAIPIGGVLGGLLAGPLGYRTVIVGTGVLMLLACAPLTMPTLLNVRGTPAPEPIW